MAIFAYIQTMKHGKIKIACCRLLFPLLLFFGAVLLSAACTKKSTALPVIGTSPTTTDTMTNTAGKKWLALGDSYTIGTSVGEADRYAVQTVSLLRTQGIAMADALIIATNGWTTGDLMAAVRDKPVSTDYDVVSLLIGVNNQYRGGSIEEYRQQFTALLQRSIQLANGNAGHVVVLSIPDYSVTPFASGSDRQKIAREIDAFNEANKIIAADYKVQYLYITDESRKAAADPSLVAADGLHFSGKEYAVWSAKLMPIIKSFLQ